MGAAAVVLLIAFGSLLAMGLPIATALMGIGSGLALIALLGHVFPAPSFSARGKVSESTSYKTPADLRERSYRGGSCLQRSAGVTTMPTPGTATT